jgi:hypothetical protein
MPSAATTLFFARASTLSGVRLRMRRLQDGAGFFRPVPVPASAGEVLGVELAADEAGSALAMAAAAAAGWGVAADDAAAEDGVEPPPLLLLFPLLLEPEPEFEVPPPEVKISFWAPSAKPHFELYAGLFGSPFWSQPETAMLLRSSWFQ